MISSCCLARFEVVSPCLVLSVCRWFLLSVVLRALRSPSWTCGCHVVVSPRHCSEVLNGDETWLVDARSCSSELKPCDKDRVLDGQVMVKWSQKTLQQNYQIRQGKPEEVQVVTKSGRGLGIQSKSSLTPVVWSTRTLKRFHLKLPCDLPCEDWLVWSMRARVWSVCVCARTPGYCALPAPHRLLHRTRSKLLVLWPPTSLWTYSNTSVACLVYVTYSLNSTSTINTVTDILSTFLCPSVCSNKFLCFLQVPKRA